MRRSNVVEVVIAAALLTACSALLALVGLVTVALYRVELDEIGGESKGSARRSDGQ